MTDSQGTPCRKLSVIIPVYNEQYTFPSLFEKVRLTELPEGVSREIIVVDDASSDRSWDVIQKATEPHPDITVTCRQETNQGKGAALRRGIDLATGDMILFQDADLEYDPSYYCSLVLPILTGDADVVYGSRFANSEVRRVLFFWHTIGNKVLTLSSNMLTNLNLTDMETGYKVARSQILKSIPIRCDRFGVEPELTAKFAKRRCRIYEVPISYHGRTYAEGKKITWWDGVKAFAVILRFHFQDDAYSATHGHDILHSLSKTHRFNRWMADTIRPWVGDHVLEIGSGLGNLSLQLLPRESYVASDIDDIYLDFLGNHFADRAHVSVEHINLEQSSHFDVVRGKIDHRGMSQCGRARRTRRLSPEKHLRCAPAWRSGHYSGALWATVLRIAGRGTWSLPSVYARDPCRQSAFRPVLKWKRFSASTASVYQAGF